MAQVAVVQVGAEQYCDLSSRRSSVTLDAPKSIASDEESLRAVVSHLTIYFVRDRAECHIHCTKMIRANF